MKIIDMILYLEHTVCKMNLEVTAVLSNIMVISLFPRLKVIEIVKCLV